MLDFLLRGSSSSKPWLGRLHRPPFLQECAAVVVRDYDGDHCYSNGDDLL